MEKEKFIRKFQTPETVRVFTQGCCYWFAIILEQRFKGTIVYNDVDNHFGCLIDGKIYDITGVIALLGAKNWYNWDTYKHNEPLNGARVIRDCIIFKDGWD